jgi:hypothetical protein
VETWKARAFCETATLDQLIDVEGKLKEGIVDGSLAGTNAAQQLKIVQGEISRRRLDSLFSVG